MIEHALSVFLVLNMLIEINLSELQMLDVLFDTLQMFGEFYLI